MGKKSRRKREERIALEANKSSDKKQKLTAYLLIIIDTILLVWGLILLEKIFIHSKILSLSIIGGGVLGVIVIYLIWNGKGHGLFVTCFYGVLSGVSVLIFFITAINYYFKSDLVEKVTLEIIETGNYAKRKSNCRKPYVLLEFKGITKEVAFPCEYEKSISGYKTVSLTLATGFLGFYVITNKELQK
ncbi:hypothetical protein [Terrimonas pollutisoli]|uniref:hypothetical protein n=1 Tax=Terrimonas pollutisoli TaxID=3034147 RepID=UPI0023EC36D6|nr:hypothetical protein [Terrimonas sp. H1YJ31]